jgi:redox-sensitive bicupin YhaK (pirin superfamily)
LEGLKESIITDPVLELVPLQMPWACIDPFIFTVHHVDHYPAGNDRQGVDPARLIGRNVGSDFSYRDGWSMYHGGVVPGFPQHPHRGFETVTVMQRGYTDHADSLGATARYGEGDTQWLTTGSGIMHSEMFPLISEDSDNPMELFQIWLNLPPETKMVDAYFAMLWGEDTPKLTYDEGRVTVEVIAGSLDGHAPPPPPPDSWASRSDSELAIWVIKVEQGGSWELPAVGPGVNRMLYCYAGSQVWVADSDVPVDTAARLQSDIGARITNAGGDEARFLLLQGRPIGAPVFQMGPFVMNSPDEIRQAVDDFRRTSFGDWPWASRDPVHDRQQGRFAIHADGSIEHRDIPAAVAHDGTHIPRAATQG